MGNFANTRGAVVAAGVLLTLSMSAPASALTAAGLRATHAAPSALVMVHDRWRHDDDDDRRYRRYHRRHREIVDAPFTHVEAGRRVIVDAPFAHVSVGRRGRHVRAPFVDLWLPR